MQYSYSVAIKRGAQSASYFRTYVEVAAITKQFIFNLLVKLPPKDLLADNYM